VAIAELDVLGSRSLPDQACSRVAGAAALLGRLPGPPRRSPRTKRSTSLAATAAQRSAAAIAELKVLADQGEAVDVAGAALVAPLGRRRLAGPPWGSAAVIAELEDRTAAEGLWQAA
jgi:hypothetical protein